MTNILSISNLISNGGPIATIAKAILLYKLRLPIFLIVKEYQGENWTDKAVLKHSLKQKTKGFFSFFLSKDRDGKMYGIAREGYWNHEKFLEFVSLLAWEYRKSGYTRMIE